MPTMTAAARREQEKVTYNPMLAACPTRQLLDVLSDKWVLLLLPCWSAARGGTASSAGRDRRRQPEDAFPRRYGGSSATVPCVTG